MNQKLHEEKRERFLRNLISEAIINVLAEQALDQEEPVDPVAPVTPTQPPTSTPDAGPTPPTPPGDDLPPEEPQGEQEFTVDTMIDKLNILRGGKSYTDPEVYGKMTTFYKNLTEEQISSMQWFLNELTKIVVDVENIPAQNPASQTQPQVVQQTGTQPAPQASSPVSPAPATV